MTTTPGHLNGDTAAAAAAQDTQPQRPTAQDASMLFLLIPFLLH